MSRSPRSVRFGWIGAARLRPRAGGLLAAALGSAICAGVAQSAESPRIAVASFVADGSVRQAADGLAEALADRLRSAGLEVSRLSGAPRGPRAAADSVRRWALADGADAIVAGEAQPIDDALGLGATIELRSGHSGGLLGLWSLPPDGGDLAAALAPIAAGIAEALGLSGPDASGASASGAAAAEAEPDEVPGQQESLVRSLRSDEPISIRSDQLDVIDRDGRRHLVFQRNVRVKQGDISLRTNKLDAFYAEGNSQPDRLIATGAVRVVQGDKEARCDSATYVRADQRVVCSGRARLTQGCDVVRGGRIELDLEGEHFRVTGAASVVLGRQDEGETCGEETS